MRRIYAEASKVLIWTDSKHEENAKGLYDLFMQLNEVIARKGTQILDVRDVRLRESLRNSFLSNEAFKANWEKALAFIQNEWFCRAWTFQEAYLSQEADIICGDILVPLDGFMHMFTYLESLGIPQWYEEHAPARVLIATYSWARFRTPDEPNSQLRLSLLLRSMYAHHATDPRDKIFAVLAMVESDEAEPYQPDYLLTMEEAYTIFAAKVMNNERHLSLLSDTARSGRSELLPSWVPDWRGLTTVAQLAERVRAFPPRYNASTGLELADPLVRVSNGSKLVLKGTPIDVVKQVFDLSELQYSGSAAQQWRRVFSSYRMFYQLCKGATQVTVGDGWPLTYGDSNESHFSAFMHTLAADALPTSSRLDVDDQKHYFLGHFELSGRSWMDILDAWATEGRDKEVLAESSGGPITDIHDVLLGSAEKGLVMQNGLGCFLTLRIHLCFKNLASEIIRSISRVIKNRSLIVTDSGKLAIGPTETEPGDTIAGFAGGDVLYVIRDAGRSAGTTAKTSSPESRPTWRLIGEAYVHGLMDGQVWQQEDVSVDDMVLI